VFIVDDRAVESLLADGNGQEFVACTYSHEDDPEEGTRNSGYGLHFVADGQYIYADKHAWTASAAADLESGARGPISPDCYCESLDPETLAVLTPASPLYDETTGKYRTNTFRPLFWRAYSLVAVPALRNLPPASLSAERTPPVTQPASKPSERRNEMNPELLKILGLPATATPAQVRQALAAKAKDFGIVKGAKVATLARQALADGEGDGGGLDKGAILGLVRKQYKIPDVINDEMLCDLLCDALGIAHEEPKPEPEPLPAAAPPEPKADATDAQMMAALEKRADLFEQKLEARAREKAKAKEIDDELLAAEKDGRLVAARREEFRSRLASETLAAGARADLAVMPRGHSVPDAVVFGGSLDPSVSVDDLPVAEASEILSRAASWASQEAITFPQALEAVRGHDKEEEAFHREVLTCNPDWATGKTTTRGKRWPTRMRKSALQLAPGFDADRLRFIGDRIKAGAIPTGGPGGIPATVQSQMLERIKLAGEVSSFQPPTKFQIAGFGFGFYQGTYGGNEIAPQVVGGANEEASYPLYSTEKLGIGSVNAAGLPEPVGRNVHDTDRSFWGVNFKRVKMHGYANIVEVDRRDQSAGDAVLPMGVMASATEQALTIEANKREVLQAAKILDTAQYASGFYKDLAGASRQWTDPDSQPVQDWEAMKVVVWRGCGELPELSLWPMDAVHGVRYHKDLLVAAQFAGMGDAGRPNAMVPLEMLVSIFGPMIMPTARISTQPGGANPDTPWGQNVIAAVISKGKVIAPRAFATVVSSGYPIVKTAPKELDGLIGMDVVKVSDMYAIETVGGSVDTAGTTSSAFLFQHAVKQLTLT
jgi:hypothetical protein